MSRKRRHSREEALRWFASVTLAALLASAVTSAVFLSVRAKPAALPTPAQLAAIDGQQFNVLAPSLVAAVEAELVSGKIAPASGPKQVDVVIELDHAAAQRVPLVSTTGSNMLTEAVATPWQMRVASVQDVRRFARVVDIQRSPSLRQSGYLGIVELQVDRLTRRVERQGHLPAETPQGFEVITVAKYNELEGSQKYSRQVQPVSAAREVLLEERFKNWQPVSPAPSQLPPAIGEQYHATLAACNSAEPQVESRRETLCFYYDPQAGTWKPQPQGEPNSSASP